VSALDVQIMQEHTDVIKRNTEPLFVVTKETGLKLNAETAKYIFVSRHEREINAAAVVSVGYTLKIQIIRPPSALLPRSQYSIPA
jgi:hypothetical protein